MFNRSIRRNGVATTDVKSRKKKNKNKKERNISSSACGIVLVMFGKCGFLSVCFNGQ